MCSGGKWRYLALYELDCDVPKGMERELRACAGTDVKPISDAFDLDDFFMGTAEVIVPYRSARTWSDFPNGKFRDLRRHFVPQVGTGLALDRCLAE
jgi:hypothetical protein